MNIYLKSNIKKINETSISDNNIKSYVKNETLILLLNITEDEMRVLITIIGPKEKREENLLKKKQQDIINEI